MARHRPPSTEVLREALGITALHKYGFQAGLPAFREAAVRWIERRFGHRFDAYTEMLPLIGSKEGLSHLVMAVCNPGDLVIVPEPGYQAYIGGTILAGAEPVIVPLRPEHNFLVELDLLPEETLRRTRLVYVNYPNNPTAAIAPRDYLERLVATCRKYDIVLGVRQRLLRHHLRRLCGAEHLRDRRRPRRCARVLLAFEVVPDDRVARRICRWTE